jgi:hypothetical protein
VKLGEHYQNTEDFLNILDANLKKKLAAKVTA